MKVALVHDYLREYGGAERVLEVLHEIYPKVPLYTAYCNLKRLGENGKKFAGWDIRTSWFQKFPFANRLLSPFRIFGPMMFESFDLSDYDLVISSSSATHLAKSVITKPETLHISYIHTPPRFLYGYVTSFNYKKHWWTRIGGEIINHFMRIYDFEVSQRPDILVANSKNVANRIKKFYRRDSVVIYPPVDTKEFRIQSSEFRKKRDYFLVVSRLVRGKGVDTVIMACGKLGLPLKIVGSGSEFSNFQFLISNFQFKNIELLGFVSDEELPELYAGAKALVTAAEDEDFGITSVEAQAAGTPVIAPASGGYLETVIDGETGILYGSPGMVTVESLTEALREFKEDKFKVEVLRENAEKFGKVRFKKEILELVEKNIKENDKIIKK
ncbi:glycosyltransferase [Patescibacteria group bacterium]|nr:glycosyltransferase [Patescibacteria group bacterium]